MALILSDRVKVNTTTTGTGTVVLASTAPTGYQSFAVIGDNNTTYYTIAGQTTSEWEVGIGTYYLANSSLSRTTILASSNANAAVTFSAGTKDVFVTYPAEKSVNYDASNLVTFTDTAFVLANATDSTKKAKFDASGINTGQTILYTLPQPPANAAASTLVDLQSTQAINGAKTFTGLNQNFGSSTGNTTTNIAYGAAASGNTKTVNIGTAGLSGSITNITVGSANSTTTTVYGNVLVNQVLTVGANSALGGVTNPVVAMTGSANNYIQGYIYNLSNLAYSSADMVVYPNNGTDTAGWVDMGITSLAYNQAAYAVTGPNEGYIFMSAPANTSSGNLVFATDSTGAVNAMQFYTGGFAQTKANVAMTLSNAGTLTVKGSIKANSTGFIFPDNTTQSSAAVSPYAGNSSIVLNNVNITSNANIAAGQNGFSVGPVTTANGVSVTIASGQRWVVI